jgi:hypothetical protein
MKMNQKTMNQIAVVFPIAMYVFFKMAAFVAVMVWG